MSADLEAEKVRTSQLLLGMASLFWAGCFVSPAIRPLTTADLDRMAAGQIHDASVERVSTHSRVSIQNDPSRPAAKILKSMAPVVRSKSADPGVALNSEYEFVFQSGRDPMIFQIRVCGDILCYRVGDVDYEGGNAVGFLSVVQPLFE